MTQERRGEEIEERFDKRMGDRVNMMMQSNGGTRREAIGVVISFIRTG